MLQKKPKSLLFQLPNQYRLESTHQWFNPIITFPVWSPTMPSTWVLAVWAQDSPPQWSLRGPMRRRDGWHGNAGWDRRKRIASPRCLNSASRFWSSIWTWAGPLTYRITGQTLTGELTLSNHMPWQCLHDFFQWLHNFFFPLIWWKQSVLGSVATKHTNSEIFVHFCQPVGTVIAVFCSSKSRLALSLA